ncbi:unnamed protein product [Musa acuminata subsp. burmannicoides]
MRRCYSPHEVSYADVRSWDLPSLPHTYNTPRFASRPIRFEWFSLSSPPPRPPPSRYQHTSL